MNAFKMYMLNANVVHTDRITVYNILCKSRTVQIIYLFSSGILDEPIPIRTGTQAGPLLKSKLNQSINLFRDITITNSICNCKLALCLKNRTHQHTCSVSLNVEIPQAGLLLELNSNISIYLYISGTLVMFTKLQNQLSLLHKKNSKQRNYLFQGISIGSIPNNSLHSGNTLSVLIRNNLIYLISLGTLCGANMIFAPYLLVLLTIQPSYENGTYRNNKKK